MKRKHKNDYKHVPGGFVSGNIRYNRKKATVKMGKARNSKS